MKNADIQIKLKNSNQFLTALSWAVTVAICVIVRPLGRELLAS